jgi:hypothetical protein
MTETSKETKAQRAERVKGALNPWSVYAEIAHFARERWSWPASWWRRSSATSHWRGLPTASTAELHNHKGDTTRH